MNISTSTNYSIPPIALQKLEHLATSLSLNPEELLFWVKQHEPVETRLVLNLLHIAITYALDPLLGEVAIWNDHQARYPSITIDGWIKIINRHPAFVGIEFEEGAASESQRLEFMQCTIYRNDRTTPYRIREYFEEVKSDHPLWKMMPRRMLRHRCLQQCARLAFGISTPEAVPQQAINGFEHHENHLALITPTSIAPNDLDCQINSGHWSSEKVGTMHLGITKESKKSRTHQLKQKLSTKKGCYQD